ncbi:MAG: sugar phosphate isomerase/epimerase family protein [Candidatus Dadabacteria bacterium]
MNYNRRDFVKLSATFGAGLALGTVANTFAGCGPLSKVGINKNFGLQLYTLRDVLPKDPVGVLKQVASFGYKQIESYEGPSGMFWGMKNTEFRKLMDDLGMKIVSSHCDMNKDFERKAAEAGQIGMNYLLCPHLGPQKSINDFRKFAEVFNQKGEVCKKNGMRFGYHNHDYSFVALEGQLPQDVLMQNTSKDLVDFEMDIYWVVAAGQDPKTWLDKYPGRFKLGHVKDRKKNTPLSVRDASVDLGTGSINWPQLLKQASDKGMKYFIVEQEAYENTTPLDAARADADYLKTLNI